MAADKKRPTKGNRCKKSAPAVVRPSRSVSLSIPDPLLSAYLKEVNRHPLLSREQERAYAVRYFETKDREALQVLVTSNLRFVVKIAFEYAHYRMKLLDLIQEGNMGLVKAVQDFNPYKEVRLTTYAVWWIRSYIQDAILKNFSLVKLGTTQAQKKLFYNLRREQHRLAQLDLPQSEKVKLLAKTLDVSEKEVQNMDVRLTGNDLSLNAPTRTAQTQDHLSRLSDPQDPVDKQLGDNEQQSIFHRLLEQFSHTLEGRDKVFFTDRLIAEHPLTLEQIGMKYKVSKERARQIEEQLKAKLKDYVTQHFPDYHILTEK